MIEADKSYDFDFDHQFIPCEKYDSKKGYKMKRGYFPEVAALGRYIVHIENRNGNSNVKCKQNTTLKNVYNLLKSRNISINRSRMDCGSFSKKIIDVISQNSKLFYVRVQRCSELSRQIKEVTNWETVQLGLLDVEVCSINYQPFGGDETYRYVVSRKRNKTGQLDLEFGDDFTCYAILTNDTITIIMSAMSWIISLILLMALVEEQSTYRTLQFQKQREVIFQQEAQIENRESCHLRSNQTMGITYKQKCMIIRKYCAMHF